MERNDPGLQRSALCGRLQIDSAKHDAHCVSLVSITRPWSSRLLAEQRGVSSGGKAATHRWEDILLDASEKAIVRTSRVRTTKSAVLEVAINLTNKVFFQHTRQTPGFDVDWHIRFA